MKTTSYRRGPPPVYLLYASYFCYHRREKEGNNTWKISENPRGMEDAYMAESNLGLIFRDRIPYWHGVVILSIHCADPIAEVKLLISPFLR
jgi:hypothetical protein